MDLNVLLPLATQVLGRDAEVYLNLFYRARASIGDCLNEEGRVFFMENWPKIPDFMETPEGQAAITDFLNAWAASFVPKVVARPKPEPAPLTGLAGLTKEVKRG